MTEQNNASANLSNIIRVLNSVTEPQLLNLFNHAEETVGNKENSENNVSYLEDEIKFKKESEIGSNNESMPLLAESSETRSHRRYDNVIRRVQMGLCHL